MTEIKPETVRNAENAVRDIKNWLAVFKTEYNVPDEAMKILHEKLDEIGTKIGSITCDASGVNADSVKSVADTLALGKQWLATFGPELSDEAKKVLHEKLDDLGQKLAAIDCK